MTLEKAHKSLYVSHFYLLYGLLCDFLIYTLLCSGVAFSAQVVILGDGTTLKGDYVLYVMMWNLLPPR